MEGAKIGAHRGERTLESTGRYTRIKVALYHIRVLPELYGTELSNKKWTWLDVGCGHGELLVALREMYGNNVAAKGIEPNQYKVAAAAIED
jgi:ubiquinone/menaquinone biosynthesis C-methylase UbiE